MNRPTTELILPELKAKVTFYTYLNISEFRQLQRSILKGVTIDPSKPEGENVSEIPADLIYEQQDLALKFLIKEIHTKEGKLVSDIKQFTDNLSLKDGELLYNEINKINRSSDLTPEAKKK